MLKSDTRYYIINGVSGQIDCRVDLEYNLDILNINGEVSERPKEHDWKSCTPGNRGRGFKSRPLRLVLDFVFVKLVFLNAINLFLKTFPRKRQKFSLQCPVEFNLADPRLAPKIFNKFWGWRNF